MKYCPRCNQRYEDPNLNFCLNDGELLQELDTSDAPPTLVLDSPRKTAENWPQYESPAQPTNQQIYSQPQQMYQPPGGAMAMQNPNSTLPTVALILGISSIVIGWCCYLGIPLGAASVITGYIGYSRANQDPQQFGGGPLAMIGMVLGGIGFFMNLALFLFFFIAGAIGG